MTPDIVVDVGNTRVKWGRCAGGRVGDMAVLSHDSADWDLERTRWRAELPGHVIWTIAGVVPASTGKLSAWARSHGDTVEIIDSYRKVPIAVDVDQPENVGLDRLLAAVAARARITPPLGSGEGGVKILVVDAGSAITIDLVDDAFRGGAILPGLTLMARALSKYTAQLPAVSVHNDEPFPGRSTETAIRAGIVAAGCGAIERVAAATRPDLILFAGGDGQLLQSQVHWPAKQFIRELTLDGIRIAAEAML